MSVNRRTSLSLLILLTLAPWARGQSRIDWHRVAGGGGSAAGSGYVLDATIGQSEAGPRLAGPPFGLDGGFWVQNLDGADVRLALLDNPDPVLPPTTLTYTLTVTNVGPEVAEQVSVTLGTPPGLTFVSNAGDCSTTFPCALGSLPPGGAKTIQSRFSVPVGYAGPNPIANSGEVTAATFDPTPTNNTAAIATAVGTASAHLVLTKAAPPEGERGRPIVYTISVRNEGPSDAESVVVNDSTPTGLGFVSNTGACTTPFPCALGKIPAGQSRIITATFSVPTGYDGPDPIANTALANAATADPKPGDNQDTASTALQGGVASLRFHTVAPCRLIDTRRSADPLGGPGLAAGSVRTFALANVCGIPATAQAVSINVTVTQPSAAGHLRLYPAGSALPTVSSINYLTGQTRANSGIVVLGPGVSLAVLCAQASGTTHFIMDVNGYFQ